MKLSAKQLRFLRLSRKTQRKQENARKAAKAVRAFRKKLLKNRALKPMRPKRPVLNKHNHDPKLQANLAEVCDGVVTLAQLIAEKEFYPYQISLAYRIVESLLLHDGYTLTSLMARQSGKTEVVGSIVAAIALILPDLAKKLPGDWRLNITDERGIYRGFRGGVSIGIYAPKLDQSQTMFQRVKAAFDTKMAAKVLKEMNVTFEVSNGQVVKLSNGSTILCQTASINAKIEGKTHHLLIAEEAQDIDDKKIRKSLSPMLSSTMGTMVMIGTATNKKCDFYTQIKNNDRSILVNSTRNHFFFPYTVSIKFNSLYRDYIEQEKLKLGEDSDEFRMSYECEWIFERGMFVTQEQLFQREVALRHGPFAQLYEYGLPNTHRYYSLVLGIDWGRSHDSTVLTVMAVDWNNPVNSGVYNEDDQEYVFFRKHVIFWVEFPGDDYETQYWKIDDYVKYLLPRGLKKIVMDSNACGLPMFDRFVANFGRKIEVEPFTFQRGIKSDAYKSFYADILGKRLTFPAGDEARKIKTYRKFTHEMLDLQKKYENGNMVVAHPDDKNAHDDYPDSTCLAAWGCSRPAMGSDLRFEDSNFFYAR